MSIYRQTVRTTAGNQPNPAHPRFLHQPTDQCLVSHKCVPVFVIDPEAREEVDHLIGACDRHAIITVGSSPAVLPRATRVDLMQDALRSLVAEPKPDEPMGLGAVVETVHGEIYVRDKTTTTVAHWKRAKGEESGKRHRYADLDAVRVLSPGWEPDQ